MASLKLKILHYNLIETEAFTRHPSSICGSPLIPEHLEREAGIDSQSQSQPCVLLSSRGYF